MLFVLIGWRIDPQSYASRMDLLSVAQNHRIIYVGRDLWR